jgi:hypothetical protein
MSYAGLEALAGEVPPLPAKASSPALVFSLSIIHYPLSIIHFFYCQWFGQFFARRIF